MYKMNIDGGVLQAFETTVENKKVALENDDVNVEVNEIVVFKRSTKYIKYLNLFIKRIIDIVGSLVGIAFLIPLIIVVKFAYVLDKDYGPVIFSQERVGLNGKKFKMYKFRSMVMNADEELEILLSNNEKLKNEYLEYKKLQNDPRITKVGKFLRKTSIDEFPQFINIFQGKMSLVGPRAYLPNEIDEMGRYYNIIIKCKPGLTGLWQVNGRSNVTFAERLNMDVEYYKTNNVISDCELLLKTFLVVLNREGAR